MVSFDRNTGEQSNNRNQCLLNAHLMLSLNFNSKHNILESS